MARRGHGAFAPFGRLVDKLLERRPSEPDIGASHCETIVACIFRATEGQTDSGDTIPPKFGFEVIGPTTLLQGIE
jgi:hypothetical protein